MFARKKIAEDFSLEVRTNFYNLTNNTNITTDDMRLIIEKEQQKIQEEKLKEKEKLDKIRQIILEKISKNEALTPTEYEIKKDWDYEIDKRNNPEKYYKKREINNTYSYSKTSPFEPMMMAAWVMALWSLVD